MLRLFRRDDRVSLNESVLQRRDTLFEGELHLFRLLDGRHLEYWAGQVAADLTGGYVMCVLLGSVSYSELPSDIRSQTLLDC